MVLRRAPQKGITFGYCDTNNGQRVYPPREANPMTDILPEQVPPERRPAPYPQGSEAVDMDTFFNVTTWPPLNQATTIANNEEGVTFTVLLETNAPSAVEDGEPQVCLWHNLNGITRWAELPLHPIAENVDTLLLSRSKDRSISRYWFTADLKGVPEEGKVLSFTVKFHISTEQGWKWIKGTTGIDDGHLHYQSKVADTQTETELSHWFEGIDEGFKAAVQKPETDNTTLFELSSSVGGASGEDSSYQDRKLGVPIHATRWFALVRLWTPWLAPRQGSRNLDLDKEAILLSFLRSDGLHVVCLAISGVDDMVSTFVHGENGSVILKSRNDRKEEGTAKVLVAIADSFEVANAAVMYHARKVVRTYAPVSADEETALLMDEKVKPEWLEEWYDGLAYCTWNGLGQKLTAQKIYTALDSLKAAGITISNLIIDDNWQSLSEGESQFQRRWSRFEANSEGFPDGLRATTTEIRKRHPNINHIAVWHALLGYWGGIDPKGWIAQNYKTVAVENEPGVAGGQFTYVAGEDAKRMYDDFYSFLSSAGVDSVKTDAQFFLDLILHAPDRRALTTAYQDAWTIAHLRHFSSRAISCMSQSPQILFYSQLPTNKPRLLVRNSDDFFPEIDASHPWHVFCNAHNSLFAQHLNVLPDWDMFQTVGKWSAFHAAARCVSGGPIYFTDEPGKHDFKLLSQMTARTTRDKTVILRPHIIGKSIDPYAEYSTQAMLKIGTYVGYARTGTGILGVFNVSKVPLSEFIPLSSFPGTEEGDYIVGSLTSDVFSPPLNRKNRDIKHAMIGASLTVGGWDILTAYPLKRFPLGDKTPGFAMLGLRGKMTGAAAVTGYSIYVEDSGNLRVWASIKALGVLGLYISDLEQRDVKQQFMVLILGKPIPFECVTTKGKVLEVDVERAWRESGESPGWSNEVSLEIFVHKK